MYPYAIRILNGVTNVEFLMKVSPPIGLNARLETVKSDTVRGELVLFILKEGRRDSLEHQAFKEKNEHYIVIPEQQQRFETQFKLIEARIAYDNWLQRWNATQARARMPVDTVERKGTPAPNFTYNDVNDNPVSLSDFKGKLIYLDVWGTWCGPCLAQKPSLKKLKGQFEDNDDIVFISISGERSVNDVQKWKDFVEKEQLPGVHLFGRTTGDDDIANLYKISGYPTFFIIGKDGNFISTNAPRPTSDALEGILRRLLAEK
jgi:thiol-disulfide isomerase/thioredoxin